MVCRRCLRFLYSAKSAKDSQVDFTSSVNGDPELSELAEPACPGLDQLDLPVQPFGHGIAGAMTQVSQKPRQVILEHLSHFGQVPVAQS